MGKQRLDSLCSINPEGLGPTTPYDFVFDYIDISSVNKGRIDATQIQRLVFTEAPSRARRRIRKDDALLCTVRPGLKAHARILQEQTIPMVASTGFAVLRANDPSDSGFIYHQIFSDDVASQLRSFEVGSSYPAVNESDVRHLMLFVPDPCERRRIAHILDTIDDAIAKTEAVIAKLKQIRAGLLHDLLTCGLDKNGQLRDPIAHPEQFKDSPLGRIPKEWDVSIIYDVADKIQDGTHFSPKSSFGPKRYLTSKNVRFGFVDISDSGWISENEHHEIYKRCDVKKGDVLLTKDGANTGNAAISTLEEEYSLLSSVAFIRGRDNTLHPPYLLNYLLSSVGQKRLKDLMSGNAITRLTLKKIEDYTIPVPSFLEQVAIAVKLSESECTISAYEIEMGKYLILKSGLMTDLLTGEVLVSQAAGGI